MNNMPPKLREELSQDRFYERCAITGTHKLAIKVEWHHNLIYAGKQVQDRFCILPLAWWVHERARESMVKERLDWVMLNRATDEELFRYSKVINLSERRSYYNEKYGSWYEGVYIGMPPYC